MLRITSFKARASERTANAGRERPLTAARGRGVRSAPRDNPQAPEARTRTGGAIARRGDYLPSQVNRGLRCSLVLFAS